MVAIDQSQLKIKSVNEATIPPLFEKYYRLENLLNEVNSENFNQITNDFLKIFNDSTKSERDSIIVYLKHYQPANTKSLIKYKLISIIFKNYGEKIETSLYFLYSHLKKLKVHNIEFISKDISMYRDLLKKEQESESESEPEPEPEPIAENIQLIEKLNSKSPSLIGMFYRAAENNWFETLKFLILKKKDDVIKIADYIQKYIVQTGNKEIIQLYEENGFCFDDCFKDAIASHYNDIADYFLEKNYKCNPTYSVNFYNIKYLVFALENKLNSSAKELIQIFAEMKFLDGLRYLKSFGIKEQFNFDEDSIFFKITQDKEVEILKELLDLCIPKDDSEAQSMFLTIDNNDFESFKLYVDHGFVDLHSYIQSKKVYFTPLSYSIYKDRMEFVKYLLDHQANPNYNPNNIGSYHTFFNSLYACLDHQSMDYLKLLIDHGVVVSQSYDQDLYTLASHVNIEALEYFLSLGLKPKIANNNRLLVNLVGHNRLDLVKKFVDMGYKLERRSPYPEEAQDNIYEYSTLSEVCTECSIEFLEYFVEMGCNFNAKIDYSNSKTPCDLAISSNNLDNLKFIIEHGGKISNKYLITEKLQWCTPEFATYLLDTFPIDKGDPKYHLATIDEYTYTSFDLVCNKYPISDLSQEDALRIIEKALKNRNGIIAWKVLDSIKGDIEYMPEGLANRIVEFNDTLLLQKFVEKDADLLETTDDSISPLVVAAQNNNTEIARILLENEFSPNYEDSDINCCALYYAAIHNNFDLVKLLVEHGAEPIELTPSTIERYNIRQDILEILPKESNPTAN